MDAPTVGSRFKGKVLIGRVVDNNDPRKCQRVRIRLPEVYDDVPDSSLPWAIPKVMTCPLGQGGGASGLAVPVVDSLLYVELQEGDPHFPVYVAAPAPASAIHADLLVNYPNRYGYIDPQGNGWWVDMSTHETLWRHHSGTSFKVGADGTVTQTVKGDWHVNVSGNIRWGSGGDAELKCSFFNVV